MFLWLLIQLGLFLSSTDNNNMETHQIVPELIDSVPPHVVTVKYAPGVEMNLGAELTPLQVKDAPIEVKWPSEVNSIYSVVFTDPDAPSRAVPLGREVLHWLVVNIPGDDLSKGDVIAPYGGAGAPDGTGLHRYVLYVFKQNGPLAVESFKHLQAGLTGRLNFDTRAFGTQNKLGNPIAVNFCNCQCDDYIRQRNRVQLETALKEHGIVPNVIERSPEYSAGAFYASKGVMRYGGELTPSQVRDPPRLVAWRTEPNALYTLIMIDHVTNSGGFGSNSPDSTSNSTGSGLNWLVVNIPGIDIQKGETLTEYIGTSPPGGATTATHQYILLVFKQSAQLSSSMKPKSRIGFNIKKFVQENKLGEVPTAGNFYCITE